MGNITKDLLRRDECQPLTSEQIADIKAQTATRQKANVYIKPYEIMDLDGTEQVVGEVQKTIDGVKKKKPLYGKTFFWGTNRAIPDQTWTTNILGVSGIDIKYSCTYIRLQIQSEIQYLLCEGYYRSASEYITLTSTGNDLNVLPHIGAGTVYLYSCYIKYTKDSDSWEVV